MNNNIDYTTVIDCGLCHEEVAKEDRVQVQARSRTNAIFYWPAYLAQRLCLYSWYSQNYRLSQRQLYLYC
jgi:hypothetical protein